MCLAASSLPTAGRREPPFPFVHSLSLRQPLLSVGWRCCWSDALCLLSRRCRKCTEVRQIDQGGLSVLCAHTATLRLFVVVVLQCRRVCPFQVVLGRLAYLELQLQKGREGMDDAATAQHTQQAVRLHCIAFYCIGVFFCLIVSAAVVT